MTRHFHFLCAAAAIVFSLTPRLTTAQVGNDNPTGVTGMFNGNSYTACSYEPYTANATRRIIDMTVSGGVGAYPLQWSRIYNSRGLPDNTFAIGGCWNHSYKWAADAPSGSLAKPSSYNVYYPDGRVIQFVPSTKGDTAYMGPAGVADRFQPAGGTGDPYLILPDGGKVVFHQTAGRDGGIYDFNLTPKQITDPNGLVTTFTLDAQLRIQQITEPAGRWIKITYGPSNAYINRVDAGYGTGTGTITQTASAETVL